MAERTPAAVEQAVREVMAMLDGMRFAELSARFTDDAQGVDEISRGWIRGRDALDAYLSQLEGTVSEVRSEISDVHASVWGDAGLVTLILTQTYEMDGQRQQLSAPSSFVLRHEQDAWKVALVHSVPLGEEG